MRELLRVVAGTDAEGHWSVVPDPNGTAPGRGAHLHPTAECLARAEHRRAFARALRHDAGVRGPLGLDALRQHLGQTGPHPGTEQIAPRKNGSTSS